MLLFPLGIDPRWVDRDGLGEHGLYYGPEPQCISDTIVKLTVSPEAVAYFEAFSSYDPDDVRWRAWDGEEWPVLFGDEEEDDLVASAFYWLSGWQEITTRERDQHGRFPHAASLQAQLKTTTRPVVDAYRRILAAQLTSHGVPVQIRTWGEAAWVLCPTHDIDYLRKWRKGMIYREVVAYCLRNDRKVVFTRRLERLSRFLRDWIAPGDVYRTAFERLQAETNQRRGTATFFLKTGAHGPHDVYYASDDPYLRKQIATLETGGFEVGLHPSYYAQTHPEYLADEYHRLDACLAERPASVRQHYLRYETPMTARLQEAAGFRIDSSLGFAEHEGFRHATCLPFQLFDPQANTPLDLWEMPLSVMESALFNRRGLRADEARQVTCEIMQSCKRFGGAAVMLWHNVVWDELDHPGWGRHFIQALDDALTLDARIVSLRDALHSWFGTRE